MSDNVTLNAGTGGSTVRAKNIGGVSTQLVGLDVGGETVESQVTATNPLPNSWNQSLFVFSSLNSSTAQLAPGNIFTGTIEANLNMDNISIMCPSDQPGILQVFQSVDSAGLNLAPVITLLNGGTNSTGINSCIPANGNYVWVSYLNTGQNTTTLFNLNVAYGNGLPITNNLGNQPVSIGDIGGVKIPNGGTVPVSITSSVPVPDPATMAAQYSDSPQFFALTGDPTGDYAGMDMFSALFDPLTGLSQYVTVVNPAKMDSYGALVESDAPVPIQLFGKTVAQNLVVDTTGYDSLSITTELMAATVWASNDQVQWVALSGINISMSTAYVTAVTAANTFSFPCIARWIKFTVTTIGNATAYLRSSAWCASYLSPIAQNVSQIGGAAVAAGTAQLGINIVNVGGTPQTAGGISLNSLASTNGQTVSSTIITATAAAVVQVKAGAGRITMLQISNGAANAAYVHLQNSAAAATSTAAFMTIAVPAVAGTNINVQLPDGGLYFGTGIAYTVSGAIASADTTALTAPSLAVNISYI